MAGFKLGRWCDVAMYACVIDPSEEPPGHDPLRLADLDPARLAEALDMR